MPRHVRKIKWRDYSIDMRGARGAPPIYEGLRSPIGVVPFGSLVFNAPPSESGVKSETIGGLLKHTIYFWRAQPLVEVHEAPDADTESDEEEQT